MVPGGGSQLLMSSSEVSGVKALLYPFSIILGHYAPTLSFWLSHMPGQAGRIKGRICVLVLSGDVAYYQMSAPKPLTQVAECSAPFFLFAVGMIYLPISAPVFSENL